MPFRSGVVSVFLAIACTGCAGAVVSSEPVATSTSAFRVPSTAVPTTMPPTTQPEPTTTVSTIPPKGHLVIHGVGDVNLDPGYLPALESRGYEWAWSGLEGLFLTDDLTVVNLECSPSSLGVPEPKEFTFQCAEEGLEPMAAAGVEVANLGNNHSQDFGKEAMLAGRANLIEVGIAPVGAGANAGEAHAPAFFEIGGWTVGVVGFGGIRPHDGWIATDDTPGMADGDTTETMVAAVEAAAEVADIVIVTVHWGRELQATPQPDDVERARAMIAAGADVIFGHHPHRLQPFEMIEGRPVAWSLGNFVWPNLSAAGSTTAVARVDVTPDGEISGCLLPALIESSGHPVLTGRDTCEDTG
ncbi:MAG TPA: CapA family protein [Acidimicrobiia bacterium]